MKFLFKIILFLLIGVSLKAQQKYPVGFPSPHSTNWYEVGYLQSDSGSIPAFRDTSFAPRFQGTTILWLHTGVDTVEWWYIGNKWIKKNSGTITPSNIVNQYLNGFDKFVTFSTDSIPQGSTNLYFNTSDTAGLSGKLFNAANGLTDSAGTALLGGSIYKFISIKGAKTHPYGFSIDSTSLFQARSFALADTTSMTLTLDSTSKRGQLIIGNARASGYLRSNMVSTNDVLVSALAGKTGSTLYGAPQMALASLDSSTLIKASRIVIDNDSTLASTNAGIFMKGLKFTNTTTNRVQMIWDQLTGQILTTPIGSGGGSGITQLFAKAPIQILGTDTVKADTTTAGTGLSTLYQNSLKLNVTQGEYFSYLKSHGVTTLSLPAPISGGLIYNQDSSAFQYSDGISWYTIKQNTSTGGFNKYIYNTYGSPSIIPIIDNIDQYVDGVNGNNANSGTSESLPKKTIASAMTVANGIAATNSSSRISIRDSSEMHETIVPGVNGIRMSSYKLGYNREVRLPIVTGSDANKTGWTKTAGRTNIWQKNIPNDLPSGSPGYDIYQVVEIDTTFLTVKPYTSRHYLPYKSSLAICDTIPGSWYTDYSSGYANPQTIYIHTSSNDQPDTNAYNYDVTERYAVINVANPNPGKKNTFLENLYLRDAASGYGEIGGGDSTYVHNCFLQGGGTHAAVVNSGTIDNIVTSMGAITPAGQISIAFYNATGKGRYNKLTNSVILTTPQAVICHQSGTDSAYMEEIYLENDYMWSVPDILSTGISADLCKKVVMRNCYIDSFGTAFVAGHGDNTIERTVFRNCTGYIGLSSANPIRSTLKLWNSIVETIGIGAAGFGTASLRTNEDSEYLDVRQNIMYSKSTGASVTHSFFAVNSGIAGTTKSYQNIFIATNPGLGVGNLALYCTSNTNSHATPYSLNYIGDYNCFIIGPGSAGIKWNFLNNGAGPINTTSLSVWQTTTGQDLHSIVIDVSKNPLGLKAIFVDPDNGNWQLLPIGTALADSVRAHSSGLASGITSYPKRPTIEDAVYAMQAGGPPSFAARWVNASASAPSPSFANDATVGLVKPSDNYFRTNAQPDNKLTTKGGPVDVLFSANNNVISNNGIWYANNVSNSTVNYAVTTNLKIPANTDGYFQYLFAPDSNCQNAFVGLSTGRTATSFGNFYIGSAIYTAGGLFAVDGYGTLTSASLTPTTYTWIRIKRTGTVITLESSADEINWTLRRTYTATTNQDLYPILNFDNSTGTGRAHVFYPKIYNAGTISVRTIPDSAFDLSFTTANNLVRNGTIWRGTNNGSFGSNYGIGNRKLTTSGEFEVYIGTDSASQGQGIYLSTNDSAQKYSGNHVPFVALIYTSNLFYYIDGISGSLTSTGVVRQLNSWYRLNRVDSIITLQTSQDDIVWTTIYTYATHYTGDLFPQIFADNTVTPSHVWSPRIVNGSAKNVALLGAVGSNPPFADNTALIKNNSDNTKLLIISAGSISTATTRTATFPDANITVADKLSPLSQFASTTSAQLLGVISDETGTGSAVFGTSPSIATPLLTGLASSGINDSVVTVDPATGQVHWRYGTASITFAQGLYAINSNTAGLGGTPFTLPDTIKTAGFAFSITGLPNKTPASTDSTIIQDNTGKLFKVPYGAGIVAAIDYSSRSAPFTPLAYTVTGPGFGTFRVGAYLTIISVTVDIIQVQVTWTDEQSISRTQILSPTGTTTVGLAIAGAYTYPTIDIRALTGTAISITTILSTGGGSINYDVGGTIEQLR